MSKVIQMVDQEADAIGAQVVDALRPVHEAQILSYMKMADMRLGYLINFNEALVKNGLKRFVRRKGVLAS